MSVTVAAALKKVSVAVLSNKKARNKLGVLVLSILVGLFMPMAAVIGVFGGEIDFDDEDVQAVIDRLEYGDFDRLIKMQEKMDELGDAMRDAGYGARFDEAELLCLMELYLYQDDFNFVSDLVSCFRQDQTAKELVAEVNFKFGIEIDADEFAETLDGFRGTSLNPYILEHPETKNAGDLVIWAEEACNDHWGYVWAMYGDVLTMEKLNYLAEMFPEEVGEETDFIENNWLLRRVTDCAGLIKGYMWFDPESQQIVYGSNDFPDVNANTMFANATETGTIDTIPEIPGLGVWHDGHAGIYVGNGYVIHANGTHRGVEKQLLSDTKFTHWFKVTGIEYAEVLAEGDETEPT